MLFLVTQLSLEMTSLVQFNQNSKQLHVRVADTKRGKTCESNLWLGLVLLLIKWQSGAGFLAYRLAWDM